MEVIFLILFIYAVGMFVFSVHQAREKERKIRALRLSDIDNMPGIQFEHYVAKLLEYQGFRTTVTVGSGDFGVDVIAEKSPLKYAIQVKRQSKNVSRRAVSDSVAGKIHYRCNAAMVVTNAFYTAGAKELAKSTECRLVDRDELTQWIMAFQSSGQN